MCIIQSPVCRAQRLREENRREAEFEPYLEALVGEVSELRGDVTCPSQVGDGTYPSQGRLTYPS